MDDTPKVPSKKMTKLKKQFKADKGFETAYTLDVSVMKDELGRYRTMSLFKEFYQDGDTNEKYPAIFTMKPYDMESLPSFKKLYLSIGDPTEYRMAMEMLGSYDHWKRLIDSGNWFQPLLKDCREELAIKIKSAAIEQIKKDGVGAFSEATRLAANKLLASLGASNGSEEPFQKESAKRGRPSKEEVQRNIAEMSKEQNSVDDDYSRVIPIMGEKN